MSYIQKHAALLTARLSNFKIINDKIYLSSNKFVAPYGPAKIDYTLLESDIKVLKKEFSPLLINSTSGFTIQNLTSNWYAVICDTFISVDKLKSKNRNEIVKGLNNCKIEKVTADYIAKHGYEINVAANLKYGVKYTESEESFKNFYINSIPFSEILDYWVIQYNDKPVGFCTVYLFDKIEANYTNIKIMPDYVSQYLNYALIYTMNEYYLEKKKFEYISDGYKSIVHQTNIQEFLIKKFNFKKQFMNIKCEFNPLLNVALTLSSPFKKIASKIDPRFGGLYELKKISV